MKRTIWIGMAMFALAGCEGRPRSPSAEEGASSAKSGGTDGASIAEIDLSRGAPESAPTTLFGPPQHRSHIDLVRTLTALADDADTKGVYLHLGGASFTLARAQEIGGLLGELKKKMPVVCHADDYGNATIYLASLACSKIWVSPAGGVDAVGIAAQLIFGRSLFDKLHVGVDFLQVGKYKGAEEPFTRDGPSPEARESLQGTLRGLRTAWLDGLSKGRAKDVSAAAEDGPYGPEAAKESGLVDAVGYPDDAREDIKKLAGSEHIVSRFGSGDASAPVPKGLSGVLRSLSGSSGGGGGAHVAVIPATGAISMGGSRGLLGGSDGITEKELGHLVTKVTKDSSVKAVVIRIDSPGGSALASDLLWKKLMKLREKKTLVFSVGGMAASGGYYLACTANKIVAEPTSIVGSIGVVGGKLAVGPALEQIGVHTETVAAAPDPDRAARAAYMSPFTQWDAATRARVLASMTSIYDLFLERVAEGRGLKVEEVSSFAEGRIFGGVEAKEKKLVDQLGGFHDALALAKKLAKLPDETPFDVVSDQPSFLDLLEGGGDDDGSEERAQQAIALAAEKASPALPLLRGAVERAPEIAGLAGAIEPLLAGERTLAVLPFGLTVR